MHGYFIFDVTDRGRRYRVIHCGAPQPTVHEVITALRNVSINRPPADSVLLLTPNVKSKRSSLEEIIADEEFVDRFPEVTRHFNTPSVHVIPFDHQGKLLSFPRGVPKPELLIAAGMSKIFYDRKGLLTAQDGYHYSKPSGKHSQSFLRIGNIMASSVEIDFIAFACLGYLGERVSRIYCDTGAIFPVAYAISRLRQQLLCETSDCLVESFGSFEGLKNFQFELPKDAIVLISASTSGGLVRAVQNREPLLSRGQILTLYYLGETIPDLAVCDLGKQVESLGPNAEPFRSFNGADECDLCKKGWSLISLEGDQFLPGESRTETVVITVKHSPGEWLSKFVKTVRGHSIIKAQYNDSQDGSDPPFRLFLDAERLFTEQVLHKIPEMQDRFNWLIEQNVPYTLERIIALSDPASLAMAAALKAKVSGMLGNPVKLIDAKELFDNVQGQTADGGSTIVVASTVSSGRSLHAVSQVLRAVQPNQQLHYLIGIARCPSEDRLRELRINLTFGRREHGFWLLESVFLPLSREGREDAWDQELRLLKQMLNSTKADDALSFVLKERITEIQNASSHSVKGLENNLFLKPVTGDQMKLQSGFAFLDFSYDQGDVSQAETFFVVSAILHNMRSHGKNPPLGQHSFVRKILSPRCFDRFNDGVIQSAILRAALPAEIDYSTSEVESKEMASIIDVLIKQSGNQVGEAIREFSLALATKRLRLRRTELEAICNSLSSSADPLLRAFGDCIGKVGLGRGDGGLAFND